MKKMKFIWGLASSVFYGTVMGVLVAMSIIPIVWSVAGIVSVALNSMGITKGRLGLFLNIFEKRGPVFDLLEHVLVLTIPVWLPFFTVWMFVCEGEEIRKGFI